MRAKDFKELVTQMRGAQISYFDTRDPLWLRTAKDLEAKVDLVISNSRSGHFDDVDTLEGQNAVYVNMLILCRNALNVFSGISKKEAEDLSAKITKVVG